MGGREGVVKGGGREGKGKGKGEMKSKGEKLEITLNNFDNQIRGYLN